MPVVTLRDESKEQGDFYVPRFEIKIAGVNLPRDVLRDVEQVTYKDNVKELDSFELTVNNWDAEKRRNSNTSDRKRPRSLSRNPLHHAVQSMPSQVDVAWDTKTTDADGDGKFHDAWSPAFPRGAPDVDSAGLECPAQTPQKTILLRMERRKDAKARSPRASRHCPTPSIAKGKKRFPLPVEIDPNALEKEEQITYVAQNSQYDIDFLLALAARRIGYVVFVKEEEQENKRVVKPRRLYFGPSDAKHPDLRRRLSSSSGAFR